MLRDLIAHDASGFAYGRGLMLATSLLHGAGIAIGGAIAKVGSIQALRTHRASGVAMAVAGVGIPTGIV